MAAEIHTTKEMQHSKAMVDMVRPKNITKLKSNYLTPNQVVLMMLNLVM